MVEGWGRPPVCGVPPACGPVKVWGWENMEGGGGDSASHLLGLRPVGLPASFRPAKADRPRLLMFLIVFSSHRCRFAITVPASLEAFGDQFASVTWQQWDAKKQLVTGQKTLRHLAKGKED